MRRLLPAVLGVWLVAFYLGTAAEPFGRPLDQIASTMAEIKDRMEKGCGGDGTQELQRKVLARLDEFLKAVEAQEKEAPTKKQKDLISELKMVRSMQSRVNTQTKLYAKEEAELK